MESNLKLYDTDIWKKYKELAPGDEYDDRRRRVSGIYKKATDLLTHVSAAFPNYTLHDETHIINVLAAMSGILGDRINDLSIQECEVLMISASLHDVGMSYTPEQEIAVFKDTSYIKCFLEERYPGEYELDPSNWTAGMKQNYKRYLHPFRIQEIIDDPAWNEVLDNWPIEMIDISTIVDVCKAHGMTLEDVMSEPRLKYYSSQDTDALFCAMMLRLADLLDFDGSRAPTSTSIELPLDLYSTQKCQKKI